MGFLSFAFSTDYEGFVIEGERTGTSAWCGDGLFEGSPGVGFEIEDIDFLDD